MRFLTAFILLCITTVSWGQSLQAGDNRFLTYKQNEYWLINTKSLDKSRQWTSIKRRFFSKENENTAIDSVQYSPMIVVNGVPLRIPDKLTDKGQSDVLNLLNEESITQIEIIDTTPEDWIFHKPFSGVIILTVDKKTDKKLFKLKLG